MTDDMEKGYLWFVDEILRLACTTYGLLAVTNDVLTAVPHASVLEHGKPNGVLLTHSPDGDGGRNVASVIVHC